MFFYRPEPKDIIDHLTPVCRVELGVLIAFPLTEKGRDGRLLIESYIENAHSAFYASDGSTRLKTIDAFERAAKRNSSAAKFWLNMIGMHLF